MIVDDKQLHQRRCAGGVDHDGDLMAGIVDVGENLVQNMIDDLVCRAERFLVRAGLAVDADADLHLVLAKLKAGLTCCRDCAGTDGDAHGAHVVNDLLRHALDLFKLGALFCLCARDLVDKDRARYAAAADGIEAAVHGDVVVDDDLRDLDLVHLRHFTGHFEVHHVAGIVLDDHQHALVSRDGLDALIDLIRRGRGEDCARDRRIQHTRADVAAVRRFVAGAAAGDQRDLPFLLFRPHDHVAAVQLAHILRIRLDHALDHLILYKLDLVDEFFHVFVLLVSLLHQILPASAYHTSLDESIVSTPQNATHLSMTHNSLTVSENCTKSFCSRAGLDRRAGFVYSIEHEYHAGGGGDALRVFRRRRFPHF